MKFGRFFLQLSRRAWVIEGMKVFSLVLLKILVVAVVLWLLLENAPLLVAPIFGAIVTFIGLSMLVLAVLTVGATFGLAVVVALLAVAVSLAAALSPVWLPLLAIVGIVALCRSKPSPAA